jgi:N-acetylmuramoyl-L-alanine amidase
MYRSIDRIIIHCTGTLNDVPADVINKNFKTINHWDKPGYHFLIDKWGYTHSLLSIYEVSNGAKGYNDHSINIAYIGGEDSNHNWKDTRTELQKQTLLTIVTVLHNLYKIATIVGHGSLPGVNKACPCFDVQHEYLDIVKS